MNYWNGRKKCFFISKIYQNALYFLFLYYFLLTVFSSVLSSPRTSTVTSPPNFWWIAAPFFRFVPPHRIVSLHRRPCFFTACAVSLHCYFVAAPPCFCWLRPPLTFRWVLLAAQFQLPTLDTSSGLQMVGMRPRRFFLAARTFVRISSPSCG